MNMEILNIKENGEREGAYDELVIWDMRIFKLVSIYKHDMDNMLKITVKDCKGDRLSVDFIIPLKGYYDKYSFLEKRWTKKCEIYKEMTK